MEIQTELLAEDGTYAGKLFPAKNSDQTYCGLDCCLTMEILGELEGHFPDHNIIYDFERALQGPYLDIMLRGFKINQYARTIAAQDLREKIFLLQEGLDEFARAIWSKGLNPRSYPALAKFFYEEMQIPPVYVSQKGVRRISCNREALEQIGDYFYAKPFVNSILAIRDYGKQLSVFETQIDPDGRYRTSYNVAGTETGRPSSSENAFGTGGNTQNIAPSLRYVFEADDGYWLCVIDLEQVEARDVGFFCGCLFDDWSYLDSCESGDLHTNNCKLIWPELKWTGNPTADRALADAIFYRDFSHRDMSKRGGHLTNYFGTAFTAARSLKVPIGIMEEFQARYCKGRATGPDGPAIIPAYPAIPRWWEWTSHELQTKSTLTTPFGRKRHFFGRSNDDATLREAIAYMPQSTTADRMNLGLWRAWKHMPECQFLAQTFDSVTFQVSNRYSPDEIIPKVMTHLAVELFSPSGRKYVVPGEAKVGWNWGAEVTEADQTKARLSGKRIPRLNLAGLRKWKPGGFADRKRPSGIVL